MLGNLLLRPLAAMTLVLAQPRVLKSHFALPLHVPYFYVFYFLSYSCFVYDLVNTVQSVTAISIEKLKI